jgi:glycerol-3-phosphate acyltransferase PlsX
MGGDLGPAEVVAAVKLALHQYPALNPITLVGHEAELNPLIALAGLAQEQRLSVFHASEVVTMDDKPLNALKKKKDSSMVRAIELVKNREAGVVVSCGNTGALMAGGTLRLRTMEGVARPALAAICPRQGGHFVLIDAGANPEAKAEHLVHNAIMGSHYCRVMLGIKSPRVGLLALAISVRHPAKKLQGLGLKTVWQTRICQPNRRHFRRQVKPHCQVRLANQIGLQPLSRLHFLL